MLGHMILGALRICVKLSDFLFKAPQSNGTTFPDVYLNAASDCAVMSQKHNRVVGDTLYGGSLPAWNLDQEVIF